MQVMLGCYNMLMESSQWKNLNNIFVVQFRFKPHCQFRGVDQGTKVFVYGFQVEIFYDKPISLSDPSSQMQSAKQRFIHFY